MAINKKLIHFKTYQAFNKELEAGNILETSVVWIKDTQQIYTHGQFYDCAPDSALTILMTGYEKASGDTAILPTDTLAVAMGKLQKLVDDNKGLSDTAFSQLKASLGFGDSYAFEPTSETLAGMTVTEAIDWIAVNSGTSKDWSALIGTNTYDGANYISKETNLTDAAMQLDTEIKATNDNLAILNAASIKGVKIAGASGNLAPQTGVVTIPNATTSSNGLISAADKQKVDKILTSGDGTQFLANNGSYKSIDVPDISNLATKEEVTQGLAGKANTSHTHTIANISDLQNQLNSKAAASHTHTAAQVSGLANVAKSGSYNDLTNKPSIPTVPSGAQNAVNDYNRNTGHNTATSLANVATTKRLVVATISKNQSFTTANSPGDGKELHIIVHNTSASDITVSMPTTSSYVNMSGDSLTVPANGYAEINVVFDNTYRYIRFAPQF